MTLYHENGTSSVFVGAVNKLYYYDFETSENYTVREIWAGGKIQPSEFRTQNCKSPGISHSRAGSFNASARRQHRGQNSTSTGFSKELVGQCVRQGADQ